MGNRPLRNRQAMWKQPLAEAATRCEPLKEVAARLSQSGGEENGLWLAANESPKCAPLGDTEFRINTSVRLDLPEIQQGLQTPATTEARYNTGNQMPGTP